MLKISAIFSLTDIKTVYMSHYALIAFIIVSKSFIITVRHVFTSKFVCTDKSIWVDISPFLNKLLHLVINKTGPCSRDFLSGPKVAPWLSVRGLLVTSRSRLEGVV